MPEITKTSTVTEVRRTVIEVTDTELEAMLRERFNMPHDTLFRWNTDRYEDFEGVTLIHETKAEKELEE